MELVEGAYIHNGISLNISEDFIKDANYMGIDLLEFVSKALDKMTRNSEMLASKSIVNIDILNEICEPENCVYAIRIRTS